MAVELALLIARLKATPEAAYVSTARERQSKSWNSLRRGADELLPPTPWVPVSVAFHSISSTDGTSLVAVVEPCSDLMSALLSQ